MILVTGGAGYIGSHVASNWWRQAMPSRCSTICVMPIEKRFAASLCLVGKPIIFVEGDVRDRSAVKAVFACYPITAIIHLAGLKSVDDSVCDPLSYYDANVAGIAQLLAVMAEHDVKRLIFSSSATVYGVPKKLPLTEEHSTDLSNPYGRTKLIVEQMLADLAWSDPAWRIGVLRYFNPVGAHHSGMIGEDPTGPPNNLMPFVAQVAAGRRPHLTIFGDTYQMAQAYGITFMSLIWRRRMCARLKSSRTYQALH